MEIRLFNTLTNQLERFEPLNPGQVKMYSCGPTVYDFAHVGNFRSFLFADVLRRFLELCGLQVQHVMNITDAGHMTDDAAEAYGVFLIMDRVLGVWEIASEEIDSHDPERDLAVRLCAMIDKARLRRDYSAADAHRQRLIQLGYEVRSSNTDTYAKKKLA